ncbi:MAG: type II toxin-antitoxin system prevent-host-death family antitoxin [bacterium]|nr:type II toxin-antitoxin system prevent-host-death family antitoxin [bacterium]
MTVTVDLHQAKTHLSKLLDRAHAGEEIILAKKGEPYAVLGPLPLADVGRRPGRLADQTVGPEILLPLPPGEPDAPDRG